MKLAIVLLGMFCAVPFINAQSSDKLVGNDPLVMKVDILKQLATTVNEASDELAAASNSSRNSHEKQVQKLADALVAYKAELEAQVKKVAEDSELYTALMKELRYVTAKHGSLTSSK